MAKEPELPRRIAPTDDPAETVERVAPRRVQTVEIGDVLITRESAGRLSTLSTWRYRLAVKGEAGEHSRTFARYEAAAAQGEELASRRKVRLLYVEDASTSLLMDYRPPVRPN